MGDGESLMVMVIREHSFGYIFGGLNTAYEKSGERKQYLHRYQVRTEL
jgi:hypothetical protein